MNCENSFRFRERETHREEKGAKQVSRAKEYKLNKETAYYLDIIVFIT